MTALWLWGVIATLGAAVAAGLTAATARRAVDAQAAGLAAMAAVAALATVTGAGEAALVVALLGLGWGAVTTVLSVDTRAPFAPMAGKGRVLWMALAIAIIGLTAWAHVIPFAPQMNNKPAPMSGVALLGVMALLSALAWFGFSGLDPVESGDAVDATGPAEAAGRLAVPILMLIAASQIWAPAAQIAGLAAGAALALAPALLALTVGPAAAVRFAPPWLAACALVLGFGLHVAVAGLSVMHGGQPYTFAAFLTLPSGVNIGAVLAHAGAALAVFGAATLMFQALARRPT